MISRHEATKLNLRCDACSTKGHVYVDHGSSYELPDEWVSVPHIDYLIEDAEPGVVLCPNHADLLDTVHLIQRLLQQREVPA